MLLAGFARNLRDGLLVPLRACITHASLLQMLVRRDLIGRTSGTLLGKLWPLLQPALQVFGFWFLFAVVWGSSRPERGGDFSLEYLLIGLLPWLLLAEVLTRASGLFREFAALYRRTPFPVELLPILIAAVPGVVYTLVFCVVAFLYHGPVAALQSLVVMPLVLLLVFPLMLLFSVLGLFVRDFAQALPFVLTLVMYCTPILYNPSMLPEGMQQFMWLNPFADLVAVIHAVVDDSLVDWHKVGRLAAIWLVLLAPCWAVFRRSVPHVREVL